VIYSNVKRGQEWRNKSTGKHCLIETAPKHKNDYVELLHGSARTTRKLAKDFLQDYEPAPNKDSSLKAAHTPGENNAGEHAALAELVIVESLSRGIDPRTGQQLSTPRDPKVDQLRLNLLDALRQLDINVAKERKRGRPDQPSASPQDKSTPAPDKNFPNRGKPWPDEDDQRLVHKWAEGVTLDSLATGFGRTSGALAARLVHLAQVKDVDEARALNVARGGGYGRRAVPMDEND